MKIKKVAMVAAIGLGMLTVGARAEPASTWEQIEKTKTLRLGCAGSEPWCYQDLTGSTAPGAVKSGNATWRGVSACLAEKIAKVMGVKLDVVKTTWGNAVAGLQANQYDLMFVLDPTPERALAIDFAGPILWYPVALLVKDDFQPKTWAELNDSKYTFGAPTGTTFVDVLKQKAPKATIKTFQGSNDVVAAFQAGRVDGAASTGPLADVTVLKLGRGKTLVPTPVVGRPTSAGIRKEADKRWRDFLQTSVTYYYNTGATQQCYRDFFAYRGLDPNKVVSIRREDW